MAQPGFLLASSECRTDPCTALHSPSGNHSFPSVLRQRRASNSPRRIPVVNASTTIMRGFGERAETKSTACFGVRIHFSRLAVSLGNDIVRWILGNLLPFDRRTENRSL